MRRLCIRNSQISAPVSLSDARTLSKRSRRRRISNETTALRIDGVNGEAPDNIVDAIVNEVNVEPGAVHFVGELLPGWRLTQSSAETFGVRDRAGEPREAWGTLLVRDAGRSRVRCWRTENVYRFDFIVSARK